MRHTDLHARLACVRRTWNPRQRLHIGDVAWAGAHGDGSSPPHATLTWGDPIIGFADVWRPATPGRPAEASLHVAPDATDVQRAAAIDEVRRLAPHLTLDVSLGEVALLEALLQGGFRRVEGPWFARLWRDLADLTDLPGVPDGYTIRPARPDEAHRRVEAHRRCWAPARIRTLLGLPVTGAEPGSRYTIEGHRAVQASPVHRAELDLVAVAADGTFAAYAVGWLDTRSGCVLFEPVGTDPEHARRGLARAVCARVLRVARDLGATQAIVAARGDAAYPAPRRLYEGLGMREVAQVVPVTAEG